MDFRTGRKTHNTRVEEKNFFYMLWNYKTYRLFFVLVKYLQLWSTVQCLRIKFTAFQDSYDKKEKKNKKQKNRKKAPHPPTPSKKNQKKKSQKCNKYMQCVSRSRLQTHHRVWTDSSDKRNIKAQKKQRFAYVMKKNHLWLTAFVFKKPTFLHPDVSNKRVFFNQRLTAEFL